MGRGGGLKFFSTLSTRVCTLYFSAHAGVWACRDAASLGIVLVAQTRRRGARTIRDAYTIGADCGMHVPSSPLTGCGLCVRNAAVGLASRERSSRGARWILRCGGAVHRIFCTCAAAAARMAARAARASCAPGRCARGGGAKLWGARAEGGRRAGCGRARSDQTTFRKEPAGLSAFLARLCAGVIASAISSAEKPADLILVIGSPAAFSSAAEKPALRSCTAE